MSREELLRQAYELLWSRSTYSSDDDYNDDEVCAWLDRYREATTPEEATADQPPPVHTDGPAVWDLVIADMATRDAVGRQRYGTPLQPHNGRKALVDAYQEALDLVAYLRQEIYEREGR